MNHEFPVRRPLGALIALALAAPLCALAASTPYSGTPVALPATIQAVNFDKGGEGVAYHDLSSGNLGGLYRTSESVDIYASTDSVGGPYQVQNFQTGEWMAYTVSVPTSGNFDIGIRAANNYSSNCAFHIEVDGVNVSGSINVPLTGSWTTYQPAVKTGIPISAGQHVIKIVSDAQWFNVSALTVALSATQPTSGTTSGGTSSSTYAGTPYTGAPIALPVAFPAANFDKGGQGVAYKDLSSGNAGGLYRTSEDVDIYSSTDTTGGAYQVANFQTGEWMNYTVNVPANGNYDISVHAASNYSTTPAFHVEVDGANVTGSISVPKTGSWTTYQWVGKQGVPLTAGKHVLKVASDAQYFNVNAVSVLASAGTATGGTTSGGTTSGGTTSGSTSGGTTSGGTTSGGTTSGGTTSSTPPSSLLFWSGFEGSLAVAAPRDCWSNGCWQDVTGTDSSTGFTWPPKVSGGQGQFQTLTNATVAASPTMVSSYMTNQIVTMTGHKGNSTQAMLSTIVQSGCCGTSSQDSKNGSTQDPYQILPASDVPEMYLSEWVMLQPDLAQKMGSNTWRDLFEWKTTDTDYRVQLAIKSNNGSLYWAAIGDGYVPSYTEYWRVNNTSVPVPVGQWFKLEIYWKRGSGSNGRVWMAVNGQVIADKSANNIGPNSSPINRIMMNQLYSGSPYSIYQWVDDVQLWSTFPTASSGNAWYDPPYAPH